MNIKLVLLLGMTIALITCEDTVVDSNNPSPLTITDFQYSQGYSAIQWEEADSASFQSYRLEKSTNGTDYETVVEIDDVHSHGYSHLSLSLDETDWFRVVLVTVDENEVIGPESESNFTSKFEGQFNLTNSNHITFFRLGETLDLGDGSEWLAGTEVKRESTPWSYRRDTTGQAFTLQIMPGNEFEFSGDSLRFIDTVGVPTELCHFTDNGEWHISESDQRINFNGSELSLQAKQWMFRTGLDTSIFSFIVMDTLQHVASILSPDSSITYDDVDLQIIRQYAAQYTRGY